GQRLEGDRLAGLAVVRLVDLAHAARPEAAADREALVTAEVPVGLPHPLSARVRARRSVGDEACDYKSNRTVTVRITGTGTPSLSVGVYIHCLTASIAEVLSSGMPRTSFTSVTRPWG